MTTFTNKRSGDTDMPWWGTLILKYGIGAGIAAYLIWFQTTKIDKHLDNINTNIGIMRTDIVVHAQNANYNIQQNDRIKSILTAICVNSARTNTERSSCVN